MLKKDIVFIYLFFIIFNCLLKVKRDRKLGGVAVGDDQKHAETSDLVFKAKFGHEQPLFRP